MALPDRRRVLVLVAAWVVLGAAYLGAGLLVPVLHHGPLPFFALALDAAIPFLPWTIAVYAGLLPFTVLGLWAHDFARLIRASLICVSLACACFLLFPAAIERAPLDATGSWRFAYALIPALDVAHNTCPSLHVAYLGVVLASRRWPWWIWLWGIAIALSTMTTRQHVLVDVLSGALLAAGAWWLAGFIGHRPQPAAAAA